MGYYGDYFFVEYNFSGAAHKGFIWSVFLPNNVASDEIFRQISFNEIILKSGETSTERLTTNYTGTVKWTVSDENVVSFDSKTGKITAKMPGTAIISATVGTTVKSCMVFSVSQWYETETSVLTKNVNVKSIPSLTGETLATLSKGTSVIADGDFENGWNWIHITSSNTAGFIQLSDFPGIDYLMSEYHYYDEGFETRYTSPIAKIYDYADVLNDVMMENFNLKICPHVEKYTSLADRCKITTYGSIYKNNLYSECPKTGVHNSNSCLDYLEIRKTMIKEKGKGNCLAGKCLWTGHITYPFYPSVTNPPLETIIFTCRRVVNSSYTNLSDDIIRDKRLNEIIHETAHLLSAEDGYCTGIEEGKTHCSNEFCYSCNGLPIPKCIMVNDIDPEKETVFCRECAEIIQSHLEKNH